MIIKKQVSKCVELSAPTWAQDAARARAVNVLCTEVRVAMCALSAPKRTNADICIHMSAYGYVSVRKTSHPSLIAGMDPCHLPVAGRWHEHLF